MGKWGRELDWSELELEVELRGLGSEEGGHCVHVYRDAKVPMRLGKEEEVKVRRFTIMRLEMRLEVLIRRERARASVVIACICFRTRRCMFGEDVGTELVVLCVGF